MSKQRRKRRNSHPVDVLFEAQASIVDLQKRLAAFLEGTAPGHDELSMTILSLHRMTIEELHHIARAIEHHAASKYREVLGVPLSPDSRPSRPHDLSA